MKVKYRGFDGECCMEGCRCRGEALGDDLTLFVVRGASVFDVNAALVKVIDWFLDEQPSQGVFPLVEDVTISMKDCNDL